MANHTRIPIRDRFESKYEPEPNSGCWLWTGKWGSNGYGLISGGGTHGGTKMAHRVSYELFVGEVPDGMQVLHRCDTKCCVNPDHLFVGSQSDNMQDMIDKRRGRKSRLGLPLGVQRLPDYVSCHKRYYGRATFNRKTRTTKYFATPEEAHAGYLALRAEMREARRG